MHKDEDEDEMRHQPIACGVGKERGMGQRAGDEGEVRGH